GSVIFNPGETSKTVTVLVNGDTAVETNETFFLNLSSSDAGVSIVDNQGMASILNDDQSTSGNIDLSVNDISVVEGDSGATYAVFSITLNQDLAFPVSYAYSLSDVTATFLSDYAYGPAWPRDFQFAPHETSKTILVRIFGDKDVENDET